MCYNNNIIIAVLWLIENPGIVRTVYSEIFGYIEEYSAIFSHAQAYCGTFRHIEVYVGIIEACGTIIGHSRLCVTLKYTTVPYSEPLII